MGEGAYIRIQNKSSHAVTLSVLDTTKVHSDGLDAIQGTVKPGRQLPQNGEEPFNDGRRYRYIEGQIQFRGKGHFRLEARTNDGSIALKLCVDSDEWWAEDPSRDASPPILLVADVDDGSDKTRIEVRIFDNYDGSNWMAQMEQHIRDVPFNRVALPGTHDSGTYKFNAELGASPDNDLTSTIDSIIGGVGCIADRVLGAIFERLCKCQTMDFEGQLGRGIRYFDMRIAFHEETRTFHTCHGVYCVEMGEALGQFKAFLDEHEKVSWRSVLVMNVR